VVSVRQIIVSSLLGGEGDDLLHVLGDWYAIEDFLWNVPIGGSAAKAHNPHARVVVQVPDPLFGAGIAVLEACEDVDLDTGIDPAKGVW
jgi:hypothetical protein